jgi:hypothetical protein
MTKGRGFAQNVCAANEWMPGTMTKRWLSEIADKMSGLWNPLPRNPSPPITEIE